MERVSSSNAHAVGYADPAILRYTTAYFIRLLVERHAIRSSLYNPGGSVILTSTASRAEGARHYSSIMGNDLHCDLLDAEKIVCGLPVLERQALMVWIDGMTASESAYFANIAPMSLRKRREHREQALAIAGEQWKNRHNEEVEDAQSRTQVDATGGAGCLDPPVGQVQSEVQ